MSEDEQVQLVLDKAAYKAGDKARVLIQSPYVPARALVTVERQGVLYEQQVEIKQSAQTVEIPVDEAFMPNAFVSVVLVRGAWRRARRARGWTLASLRTRWATRTSSSTRARSGWWRR